LRELWWEIAIKENSQEARGTLSSLPSASQFETQSAKLSQNKMSSPLAMLNVKASRSFSLSNDNRNHEGEERHCPKEIPEYLGCLNGVYLLSYICKQKASENIRQP
jgi:hypothetical protein